MSPYDFIESRTRDCKYFGRNHGNRVGRPRVVVQERHIPEEIAAAECRQVVTPAAFQLKHDSDAAFSDEKQLIAAVPHFKNRFARLVRARFCADAIWAAFFPARTCSITASENTAMLMALESVGSLGDGYVLGRCRNWLSKHDLRDELNVETLG